MKEHSKATAFYQDAIRRLRDNPDERVKTAIVEAAKTWEKGAGPSLDGHTYLTLVSLGLIDRHGDAR